MKINIKPLKGGTFEVQAEASMTVLAVKELIKTAKGWDTNTQKLIYKGKILADGKQLSEYKVDASGFLVCMVSKPKTAAPVTAAAEVAAAPAASTTSATSTILSPALSSAAPSTPASSAPAPSTPSAPAPAPSSGAIASSPAGTLTPAPDLATPTPVTAAPATAMPGMSGPQFNASVAQLKDMGFPQAECEAALRAAFGDASRAVEYLMSGIPPNATASAATQSAPAAVAPAASTSTLSAATPATSTVAPAAAVPAASTTTPDIGGGPLAALRVHPQFNDLKRLVQSNPGALSQVLHTLGQGNPSLIQIINENRELFVQMMNEPIDESATPDGATPASGAGGAGGGAPAIPGLPADMMGTGGGQGPEEIAAILQVMQNMPAEQRAQLAQAMGVQPEQLAAITQMIQTMPPQAMGQMLEAMMQGGMGGGPGGPGGPGDAGNVVHLTAEEEAAVNRLAELGFSPQACLEAYLACDKNEQLAANYLFNNPMDESDN